MVKTLITVVMCAALFAAGLAASWLLQQSPVAKQLGISLPASPDATTPAEGSGGEEQEKQPLPTELPLPVRDRQALSAAEIFRFGETYRNQQKVLQEQQEQLRRERHRIQLVYEDIRGVQRELDGFQSQLEDTLQQAQELLQKIHQQRHQLQQTRQEVHDDLEQVKNQQTVFEQDEMANLKKMAEWFQAMEPEKAAEILVQYSNDGKLDTAVKLLSQVEERNVAKILSAIEDPALGYQLSEKYLTLKRPPPRNAQR